MTVQIGEAREALGRDVWQMAEDFANKTKSDTPYYIVYACKEDRGMSNRLGRTAFKQFIKAYKSKPPAMLGILVWYVDHSKSEFRFVPELSAPPDVPIDPSLLSTKACDASSEVMAQGQKLKALVS